MDSATGYEPVLVGVRISPGALMKLKTKFFHGRHVWHTEEARLYTSGHGCHSNVQINDPGLYGRTADTPLWWYFEGEIA